MNLYYENRSGHFTQDVSRHINSSSPLRTFLFWLIGLLLIVAPLSGRADASEIAYAVKYFRIGLSAFVLILAASMVDLNQIGVASRRLVGFSVFFTLAALWSQYPLLGLINKGFYLVSVIGGVVFAHLFRTKWDFQTALRIILLFGLGFGIVIVFWSSTYPTDSYVLGRLAPFDLNANLVGQAVASFAFLASAVVAADSSSRWRIAAMLQLALGIYIVFQTGSRGSLGMILVGILLVSIGYFGGVVNWVRNLTPLFLIVALICLVSATFIGSDEIAGNIVEESHGLTKRDGSRIGEELLKDTRTRTWRNVVRLVSSSPVIGIGWYSNSGRAATCVSVYLQVLLETGIIGAVWWLYVVGTVLYQSRFLSRTVVASTAPIRVISWFGIGASTAILVHGIAESSALLGATSITFLLGFSVGLIDRGLVMANQEHITRRYHRELSAVKEMPQNFK